MIFVGYELGSKGYQSWDAAHHCIEISCDVKFNETQFPAQEATNSQASENDLPISESIYMLFGPGGVVRIPTGSDQGLGFRVY